MLNTFLAIFGIDTDVLIYYPSVLILFILGISYAFNFNSKISTTIKTATLFLCYLLFSAFLYNINRTPFNCYLFSILQTIFPFLFIYLGYYYSDDDVYNKWFLYGCAFCFIVGLIFYFTTPPFYVHYLANLRDVSWYSDMAADENTIMAAFRFSALFGDSYSVSYFSVPALVLSLSSTINHRIKIKKGVVYIFVLASFVSAILCQQRIAIAFALFTPLFYALLSIRKGFGFRLLLIYFALIILIIVALNVISNLDRFVIIKENVVDRFLNLNFKDAMSERTDQYSSFSRQTDWSLFIGLGLGSCGGYARAAGLSGITDGWFVKTFYESGIIGIFLFASVIIPTILRAINKIKLFDVELLIIGFFLAACLGADALSATIPSSIFWYCVGRIWNPRYMGNLRNMSLKNKYNFDGDKQQ